MRASSAYQNEGKLFFQMASELRHAEREGADPVEIAMLIDEIEGVQMNTSSSLLRERCTALLRHHYLEVAGNTG